MQSLLFSVSHDSSYRHHNESSNGLPFLPASTGSTLPCAKPPELSPAPLELVVVALSLPPELPPPEARPPSVNVVRPAPVPNALQNTLRTFAGLDRIDFAVRETARAATTATA